jgi:hypothetical protein
MSGSVPPFDPTAGAGVPSSPGQGQLPPDNAAPQGTTIPRDRPDPPDPRKKLVARWTERVRTSRAYFKRDFERMRDNTEFVLGAQWEANKPTTGADEKDQRYVANVALRHVQQATATLYPNNPTVIARKRPKILGKAWDGDMATLQQAQMTMQQNAQAQALGLPALPPDPNTMQILADFQLTQGYDKMMERIGKTLTYLYNYNISEQVHSFKSMMKLTIRRAVVTGVGYVKEGFQRAMKMSPEIENRLADMSERLATIERLSSDLADGEIDETSAEAEQLRLAMQSLAAEGQIVAREGLSFDYPDSWSIIPDKKCRSLRGFLGADWVAQEYYLTEDEVQEIYQIDVSKAHTSYASDTGGDTRTPGRSQEIQTSDHTRAGGGGAAVNAEDGSAICCVWDIWSRKDGTVYTVCDGYPDFLEEPHPPDVYTDAFWPWHVLLMNEAYHAKRLFPPSDIDLLRDMQLEINRARQGLREQRQANRPKIAVAAGVLEEADKEKLRTHPANAVLELNSLAPGQKVDDLLQVVKMPPIQQELYDTAGAMEDMLRVLGNQAADTGSTAGATATEASLAAASSHTASASVMDDLDELLTSLASNGGQILMLNVSQATVSEIVGPGAVWPVLDKVTVAKNVYLEIEAGSSGRPNKQQEVQNFVQLIPLLQRIPGISPEWMAREVIRRMDDRLDLTDAFVEGLPSMESMNRMPTGMGGPGGPPGGPTPPDDGSQGAPSQQGPQGAQNQQQGPPGNGTMGPRRPPNSAETIIPGSGQPLGVHPTPGVGVATP